MLNESFLRLGENEIVFKIPQGVSASSQTESQKSNAELFLCQAGPGGARPLAGRFSLFSGQSGSLEPAALDQDDKLLGGQRRLLERHVSSAEERKQFYHVTAEDRAVYNAAARPRTVFIVCPS
jgi:hypothetical protein